jgi:hypothetical protein
MVIPPRTEMLFKLEKISACYRLSFSSTPLPPLGQATQHVFQRGILVQDEILDFWKPAACLLRWF